MEALSESELTNLRWMKRVNAGRPGIGLYGPTVRRYGEVAECGPLVERGLAVLIGTGRREKTGYWITAAGRGALAGSAEGVAAGQLREAK